MTRACHWLSRWRSSSNYPSKKFLNRTRLMRESTQVAMPVNCSPNGQEMKIKTMKDALQSFEILH
jgi:hypothetical protein